MMRAAARNIQKCGARPNRALDPGHSRGFYPDYWMLTRVRQNLDRVRRFWIGFGVFGTFLGKASTKPTARVEP